MRGLLGASVDSESASANAAISSLDRTALQMDAVDEAAETARGTPAARDADGHREFFAGIAKGPVQSVHQDFHLGRPAVDVDVDVAGDLRAVVGGGDVIPALGGERLFGFDADGVVDLDAGEMHVNLAVIQVAGRSLCPGGCRPSR